jgi:hypothetical protein
LQVGAGFGAKIANCGRIDAWDQCLALFLALKRR